MIICFCINIISFSVNYLLWRDQTYLLSNLGTFLSRRLPPFSHGWDPICWMRLSLSIEMPVLIAGGDSDTASQRDLWIFSLCALIDKRNNSKNQINVIGLSILCTIMASWGLKISLGISCVLLAISIVFAVYALYMEKSNLRQIQRELLGLLRDTPSSDIRDFFSSNVDGMHEDWNCVK